MNGKEPGASELRSKLSSDELTESELCNMASAFVQYAIL